MDYSFEMQDYVRAVDSATSKEELIVATSMLELAGRSAQRVAKNLSDEQFLHFRQHLPILRGQKKVPEALEKELVELYGDILLPLESFPLFLLSHRFGASFGVVYNQYYSTNPWENQPEEPDLGSV